MFADGKSRFCILVVFEEPEWVVFLAGPDEPSIYIHQLCYFFSLIFNDFSNWILILMYI